MRFENKVALVVGSACGMGNATVKQLLREGARVVAFDNRADAMDDLADEIADECPDAPGTLDPFIGDVTDKIYRQAVTAAQETVNKCAKDLQAIYDSAKDLTISAPHSGKPRVPAPSVRLEPLAHGARGEVVARHREARVSAFLRHSNQTSAF